MIGADELAERFAGRLQFGTAGLRAAVGAGPMRMNRLVVRQAAAGLGQWLLDGEQTGAIPDATQRGVVIGYDARRKSDVFAFDTARVLAAMGIRSMLHPGVQPTPVLAWSITELDAAAGVVVTASHNPPADNGYKVYLGDRLPDRRPGRRRDLRVHRPVRPARRSSLAAEDDPLITYLDTSWVDALRRRDPGRASAAGGARRRRSPTPRCTASAVRCSAGVRRRRASTRRSSSPSSTSPTARSRRCRSRTPRSRARWTSCSTSPAACGAHVALANDPDADRLGAAIPQPDGSWRRLERRRDRLAVRRPHPGQHDAATTGW